MSAKAVLIVLCLALLAVAFTVSNSTRTAAGSPGSAGKNNRGSRNAGNLRGAGSQPPKRARSIKPPSVRKGTKPEILPLTSKAGAIIPPQFRREYPFVDKLQLSIPHRCDWALKQLYIPQRCNNKGSSDPCEARKRSFTPESITDEMRLAFMAFAPALPPASRFKGPPVVVDIGAGLAMYHAFIRSYFGNQSRHYILDRSVVRLGDAASQRKRDNPRLNHAGGFQDASKFSFYSSLECATDIARESGFDMNMWHAIDASEAKLEALKSVDIVISILSWTFHYKVETYIDAVKKVLAPGTGRLILTPRAGRTKDGSVLRNNEDLLEAGFTCAFSNISGAVAYSRLTKAQRKVFAAGSGWFPDLTVCCIACTTTDLISSFKDPRQWWPLNNQILAWINGMAPRAWRGLH